MMPKGLLHVMSWLAYGTYLYVQNYLHDSSISVWMPFLALPFLAAVFYTVYAIWKKFMGQKLYLKGLLVLLGCFLGSSYLIYLLLYTLADSLPFAAVFVNDASHFSWTIYLMTMWKVWVSFGLFAVLYYFYIVKALAYKQREAYEYTALAAQVQPHLIENMFAQWKSALRQSMPEMHEQVELARQQMRFATLAHHPGASQLVLLEEECAHAKNYLLLQQKILKREFPVVWQQSGDLAGYGLPPTTLLTLIENALKHGELTPETPLEVKVQAQASEMKLYVRNAKRKHAVQTTRESTGLYNLQRRLAIRYPNKHQLKIEQTDSHFAVRLILTL